MIPDEFIKQLYLSEEFLCIPCGFQALFFDAVEHVLEKTDFRIVKGGKNNAAND